MPASSPDDPATGKRRPRMRTPFAKPITTPPPASPYRRPPAADTDDAGTRSVFDDTHDLMDADNAHLKMAHASKRQTDRLPLQIATEQHLYDELRDVAQRRLAAEADADTLVAQLRELIAAGGDSLRLAALARPQAAAVLRAAGQLRRLERDLRRDLNRLSQHIDATPERVYEEVAIIVSYFNRDREERAETTPELKGHWIGPDNRQPGRGVEEFIARYGPLPIDSRDEIADRIAALRARCAENRQEAAAPPEVS